jgi:dehydrogenase/reductase SDR family member 12
MSFVTNAIDSALEWSMVGSFTRVGSSVRRRMDHWTPLEGPLLKGKVVVITGATSGLGLDAVHSMAAMGATIVMIVRNGAKADLVCAEIRKNTPHSDVRFFVADTGDLVALRRAAEEIQAQFPVVDVLIHNAGALDDQRQESPQGTELTVASQVVGPFLLTSLLLNSLRAASHARILWVSSGGMYSEPLSVDALEMPADNYNGVTAYARSKRAQVTLCEMMAARLAADGIVVHAMHPGWADTPGVARSLPTFRRIVGPLLRTPAEGADTLVWLATDIGEPLKQNGQFWLDRRPRPIHRMPGTRRSDTAEERVRLWRWVSGKSGTTF